MKSFKTQTEQEVGNRIEEIFANSPDAIETKLENFTKYVRRQHLKRLLSMYELFKMVLPVKGSVIEGGVHRGFGLMAWAKLSSILEPENLSRRIYGFDTFSGFPSVSATDRRGTGPAEVGHFKVDVFEELQELLAEYDRDRFLGHVEKVELIRGDACLTIPKFVEDRRHLLVSLLFLDFDLYEPTKTALQYFIGRMPKGAVLAFDELDHPFWPGETLALLESLPINATAMRRLDWDPYISYVVIE